MKKIILLTLLVFLHCFPAVYAQKGKDNKDWTEEVEARMKRLTGTWYYKDYAGQITITYDAEEFALRVNGASSAGWNNLYRYQLGVKDVYISRTDCRLELLSSGELKLWKENVVLYFTRDIHQTHNQKLVDKSNERYQQYQQDNQETDAAFDQLKNDINNNIAAYKAAEAAAEQERLQKSADTKSAAIAGLNQIASSDKYAYTNGGYSKQGDDLIAYSNFDVRVLTSSDFYEVYTLKTKLAGEAYLKAAEKDPGNSFNSLKSAGYCLYEAGEYERALGTYQRLYSQKPQSWQLLRIAHCQQRLGQGAAALPKVKEFFRINGGAQSIAGLEEMAKAYYFAGQNDSALVCYDKLIAMEGPFAFPDVYRRRFLVKRNGGDEAGAEMDWKTARKKYRHLGRKSNTLGTVMGAIGLIPVSMLYMLTAPLIGKNPDPAIARDALLPDNYHFHDVWWFGFYEGPDHYYQVYNYNPFKNLDLEALSEVSRAAALNDTARLRKLVTRENINKLSAGRSPLDIAVIYRSGEAANWLAAQGAQFSKPKMPDELLPYSALGGDETSVRLLLKMGANPRMRFHDRRLTRRLKMIGNIRMKKILLGKDVPAGAAPAYMDPAGTPSRPLRQSATTTAEPAQNNSAKSATSSESVQNQSQGQGERTSQAGQSTTQQGGSSTQNNQPQQNTASKEPGSSTQSAAPRPSGSEAYRPKTIGEGNPRNEVGLFLETNGLMGFDFHHTLGGKGKFGFGAMGAFVLAAPYIFEKEESNTEWGAMTFGYAISNGVLRYKDHGTVSRGFLTAYGSYNIAAPFSVQAGIGIDFQRYYVTYSDFNGTTYDVYDSVLGEETTMGLGFYAGARYRLDMLFPRSSIAPYIKLGYQSSPGGLIMGVGASF